jgi:hypothetical protein
MYGEKYHQTGWTAIGFGEIEGKLKTAWEKANRKA